MADLKLLSAGAVKEGAAKMALAFSREQCGRIDVEFTTAATEDAKAVFASTGID